MTDSLVHNKIVIGVYDVKVQERLLRDCELTREKAVQTGQAAARLKTLSGDTGTAPEQLVNAVKERGIVKKTPQKDTQQLLHNHNDRNTRQQWQSAPRGAMSSEAIRMKCFRCGYNYNASAQCPAMVHLCFKCQGRNHFVIMSGGIGGPSKPRVNLFEEVTDNNDKDKLFAVCGDKDCKLEADSSCFGRKDWIPSLVVNGFLIPFRLDSGSHATTLSLKDVKGHKALTQNQKQSSKSTRLQ